MGFRTNAYAKVWKIEKGDGNFWVAEMSTSKKMKKDGKDVLKDGKPVYNTDWSNKFTRLVGTAAQEAEGISDGDTIKIGECEVTNKWDAEKKVMYTNYVIYSFEMPEDNGSKPAKSTSNQRMKSKKDYVEIPDDIDEGELPFN